jgi:hypothetical protein
MAENCYSCDNYCINIVNDWMVFEKDFNSSIDDKIVGNMIKYKIKKLHFGENFNQSLNTLPEGIEEILIRNIEVDPEYDYYYHHQEAFNQSLDHLPSTIKKITIYGKFNQNIDNLPIGLETLELLGDFNQLIDNLPPGLITLYLGVNFTKSLNHIPDSIENLIVKNPFISYDSVRCSSFIEDLVKLPKSIKYLEIEWYSPYIDTIVKDHNEIFNKLVIYEY